MNVSMQSAVCFAYLVCMRVPACVCTWLPCGYEQRIAICLQLVCAKKGFCQFLILNSTSATTVVSISLPCYGCRHQWHLTVSILLFCGNDFFCLFFCMKSCFPCSLMTTNLQQVPKEAFNINVKSFIITLVAIAPSTCVCVRMCRLLSSKQCLV